ncbi:MAG: hypothetical protein ACRDRH_16955 [Pseudonocardia sp.]
MTPPDPMSVMATSGPAPQANICLPLIDTARLPLPDDLTELGPTTSVHVLPVGAAELGGRLAGIELGDDDVSDGDGPVPAPGDPGTVVAQALATSGTVARSAQARTRRRSRFEAMTQ